MSHLTTIDVVEHKVKFLGRLERVVHRDEEDVSVVCDEYVPLRHDALGLVTPHNVWLAEDLHCKQAAIRLVPRKQYLQPERRVYNTVKTCDTSYVRIVIDVCLWITRPVREMVRCKCSIIIIVLTDMSRTIAFQKSTPQKSKYRADNGGYVPLVFREIMK